jgi:hypothetical protein
VYKNSKEKREWTGNRKRAPNDLARVVRKLARCSHNYSTLLRHQICVSLSDLQQPGPERGRVLTMSEAESSRIALPKDFHRRPKINSFH